MARKKPQQDPSLLNTCPCGKTPRTLYITETSQGRKWAAISGSCCDTWIIEFQPNFSSMNGKEVYAQAVAAWNNALRGFK